MLNVQSVLEIPPHVRPAAYSDRVYHIIILPQPVAVKISEEVFKKIRGIIALSAVSIIVQKDLSFRELPRPIKPHISVNRLVPAVYAVYLKRRFVRVKNILLNQMNVK